MKEQVGVDDILEIIGALNLNDDIKRSAVLAAFVRQYLDLERLHENVKKIKSELDTYFKHMQQEDRVCKSLSEVLQKEMREKRLHPWQVSELLESLDK